MGRVRQMGAWAVQKRTLVVWGKRRSRQGLNLSFNHAASLPVERRGSFLVESTFY